MKKLHCPLTQSHEHITLPAHSISWTNYAARSLNLMNTLRCPLTQSHEHITLPAHSISWTHYAARSLSLMNTLRCPLTQSHKGTYKLIKILVIYFNSRYSFDSCLQDQHRTWQDRTWPDRTGPDRTGPDRTGPNLQHSRDFIKQSEQNFQLALLHAAFRLIANATNLYSEGLLFPVSRKFIIIYLYLSWNWATCWPVPTSRIQKSVQRSATIPSASCRIVFHYPG
jgi:hypothetical protein